LFNLNFDSKLFSFSLILVFITKSSFLKDKLFLFSLFLVPFGENCDVSLFPPNFCLIIKIYLLN